jgi:hypothetical protein
MALEISNTADREASICPLPERAAILTQSCGSALPGAR